MPERKKSIIKVIDEELEARHSERFCFTLPSAALNIYQAKFKNFSIVAKVKPRGAQLQTRANLQLIYVDAKTKVLKFLEQEFRFIVFVPTHSLEAVGTCRARLARGSTVHIVLESENDLVIEAQLLFHLTLLSEKILPVDELPLAEIHLQVTPEQTHVIPSFGTIQIEME